MTPACNSVGTAANLFYALYDDVSTGHSPASSMAEQLTIQPNPVNSGERMIVLANGPILQMELISSSGTLIRTVATTGNSGEIDLTCIPSGPYALRAVLRSGHVLVRTVVVY